MITNKKFLLKISDFSEMDIALSLCNQNKGTSGDEYDSEDNEEYEATFNQQLPYKDLDVSQKNKYEIAKK